MKSPVKRVAAIHDLSGFGRALYKIITGGYTPHHGEGKNKYLVER